MDNMIELNLSMQLCDPDTVHIEFRNGNSVAWIMPTTTINEKPIKIFFDEGVIRCVKSMD